MLAFMKSPFPLDITVRVFRLAYHVLEILETAKRNTIACTSYAFKLLDIKTRYKEVSRAWIKEGVGSPPTLVLPFSHVARKKKGTLEACVDLHLLFTFSNQEVWIGFYVHRSHQNSCLMPILHLC
jgi:hypothetical protein